MQFSITKKILVKRKSPLQGLFNALLFLVAIPVLAIAMMSLCLYYLFLWLKGLVIKEKNTEVITEVYHFECDLIQNEHIRITMIEDEMDTELTMLNEAWTEKVNSKETYLYRVKTAPIVPGLEGRICCFFCKEQEGGILLQAITTGSPGSQLIFLNYQDLSLSVVDNTGSFFLYNDDKDAQMIRGFNRKETVRLEISST